MNVADLADELLALLHDADPVGASLLGIPGRDDRLPDVSIDGDLDGYLGLCASDSSGAWRGHLIVSAGSRRS